MANTKITYSMALDFVLGLDIPTEISDKLTDLKTSITKKSANKKSAGDKDCNKDIIEEIENVLVNATSGLTVTEILAKGIFPTGTSNQKITAMLKVMPNVVRTTDKKKSLFTLADEDDSVQALDRELSM